ncbi:hypothetical protein FNL55_09785 [Tardiphaga sp. vice352]|nr:hypothetical protein FIU28_09375 [Tardiphaga sp. vice154]QDM26497.1 hypothetical protein FNL56_10620 [Tardiphaga sp. vice304]QDM31563.1 hypothetical protein FNL55_09785 [Tardiphaga sp. vice352]
MPLLRLGAREQCSPPPARSEASLGGEGPGVGVPWATSLVAPPLRPSPARGEGAQRRVWRCQR